LAEAHLVRDFFHVALTLDPHKRGGVPYEFFKEGTWKCNIDKNIEKLRDMLEDTQTSRKFSL